MMPPTSIDGTDITGATIDGTDVTEITVDGDTVFSAQSLPVAYSNLIAWYPFDSSFYGGSNADDVTALFNPGQSGDSTAYDGTVNGATYQSSGGVTDINAGANSGAFDFNGSSGGINIDGVTSQLVEPFTITVWVETDNTTSQIIFDHEDTVIQLSINNRGSGGYEFVVFDGSYRDVSSGGGTVSTGNYVHLAASLSASDEMEFYVDGISQGTRTISGMAELGRPGTTIGYLPRVATTIFDGQIDDLRIYNMVLTSSQINDIIDNTEP